jgi:uncharacterized protein (TIGR02391 family)
VFSYNTPVRITRVLYDGWVENLEASCIEDKGQLFFPIDADVEEGDLVEWDLPSGKTKAVRLTTVAHLQSPFGGSSHLDHIEADFETATRPRPVAQPKFDLPGLHSTISAAAGALHRDGHYRQAVFDAFQAVEHRVQSLTGRSESGRELMGKVFGGSAPQLDITRAMGRNAEDERGGFAQLFMGAMLGIRNPRGHGSAVQDSPEEAMEYLALASLLMRRLDIAEKRQQATP